MSDDDRYRRRDPSFGTNPEQPRSPRPDNPDSDRAHEDSRYQRPASRQPEGTNQTPPGYYDRRPAPTRAPQRDSRTNPYRADSGQPYSDQPRSYQDESDQNGSYQAGSNRQTPEQHSRNVTYPVEFHGKTSEYFKIWIVNIFLTVITLYIYSAWAKVRTKRYFYGNTTIDGSSFEYHAKGSQLVIGRLIGTVLLIVYTVFQGINITISTVALGIFVLFFPWAIWRSLRFNAKASSFRNIRFGFDGKASPPYVNLIVIPMCFLALLGGAAYLINQRYSVSDLIERFSDLPQDVVNQISAVAVGVLVLLMLLVVPLLHRNLINYSHNNHRFGTSRFSADIKTGRIYGIHFITFIMTILAVFAIGGVVAGALQVLRLFGNSELLVQLAPYFKYIAPIGAYLIVIPITGIAVAYFRSSIRNHRYNATSIDSRVSIHSTTGTWSLWGLNITNLLLLILTLGIAYPYTKIRTARYFAKRTAVTVAGGLSSFAEREKTKLHAMGEEMADAFDVEFDIGI